MRVHRSLPTTFTGRASLLVCGGENMKAIARFRGIQLAGLTERGGRYRNEDGCLVMTRPRKVLAVADGMGGEFGGAFAAKTALTALRHAVQTGASLQDGFRFANERVVQAQKGRFRGMATTLTAVEIHDDYLEVASSGDSRCFLVKHNGEIGLLTLDDTLASYIYQQKHPRLSVPLFDPEDYCVDLRSSTSGGLDRYIGDRGAFHVNHRDYYPFQPGDRLLLCTDGLYNYLYANGYRYFFDILTWKISPQAMVNRLYYTAVIANRTRDNVTLVYYQHGGPGEPTTA